ncbi:hypothetical protein WN943_017842 [Citrus x changshan-huyou]
MLKLYNSIDPSYLTTVIAEAQASQTTECCSGVFELIKLWAADKAKRWSPNIEQRPFGFSYFLSVDRSTIENKTQQLYFPSARDLRYTVSYTRPASLKPVKKLGGIATLAILLIPTHDDDVVTRDGPHGQTHVIELWTHCLTWASIVISKKAFMSYEPILELGVHEFNDQQQIIYQHSFVLCSKSTKFKYVNSFPLS